MKRSFCSVEHLTQTVPDGCTVIGAVTDRHHPIGAVLIQYTATGLYAACNAGAITSVNQDEARDYCRGLSVTVDELMAEHKLSQVELSRGTGIPVRTLQDWSSGRRTPPDWALPLVEFYLSHK